ncbi:hypothetical protein [Nocardia sp. NPDC047038]|uniref:hypothetical protein n=1 Tax=Nocardia sp. NPDC047038 TaxID=3154338 RepID=UPI0033D54EB6
MPNHVLPQRPALVGPLRPVSCDVPPELLGRFLDALGDWDGEDSEGDADGT